MQQARVLTFSQRSLTSIQPFRCPHFEFEDVIAQVDNVDMLAPPIDPSTRRHAMAKQLAYHTPLALNPGIEPAAIRRKYDLFFAICGNPTDLLRVHAAGNWRSQCRTAVCLIDELWVRQMDDYRNYLRMLRQFDLVVLYYSQSIEPLSRRIGSRCLFMPPGVDALRFCPWPDPPQRSIDVYSMGRRSATNHGALLRMAEQGAFFIYDSTSADRVLNPLEHRLLFTNLLKRSRYFIVNPGLIDQPAIRGNQIEIGNRYFEGAAGGALMIGIRPDNDQFDRCFHWPDPMIDLPWDSAEMPEIISEFDQYPERQELMRRRNVEQSLLRHDWLHRWQTILHAVGMELLPKAQQRKSSLEALAKQVSGSAPVWQSAMRLTAQ